MPDFLRAYRAKETDPNGDGPIRFIASTEGIKRDGQDLSVDDWYLERYAANPVFLWAHQYGGFGAPPQPPIGRAAVSIEKNRLMADVTFDRDDPFARDIERKYRNGFLHTVSVGWDTIPDPGGRKRDDGKVRMVHDLLDISGVPVPGDPDALMERQKRSLADLGREMLRLVEPEAEPTVTTTASDMPTLRSLNVSLTDPEPAADDSARTSWDETSAEMARLFRPYVQRPDDERRTAYQRLAREYARHDRTPPEFVEAARLDLLDGDAIRGLFLEGEADLHAALFAAIDSRAGAVLSARNRSDIEQAISLMQGVLERAKKEEEKADQAEEERLALALLSRIKGIAA